MTAYVRYVENAKGGPTTVTLTTVGGADAIEIWDLYPRPGGPRSNGPVDFPPCDLGAGGR